MSWDVKFLELKAADRQNAQILKKTYLWWFLKWSSKDCSEGKTSSHKSHSTFRFSSSSTSSSISSTVSMIRSLIALLTVVEVWGWEWYFKRWKSNSSCDLATKSVQYSHSLLITKPKTKLERNRKQKNQNKKQWFIKLQNEILTFMRRNHVTLKRLFASIRFIANITEQWFLVAIWAAFRMFSFHVGFQAFVCFVAFSTDITIESHFVMSVHMCS